MEESWGSRRNSEFEQDGQKLKQERSLLMAQARKRRFQERRRGRKYRSAYLLALPRPSDLLLSQSLARLARMGVRTKDFKKRILSAVNTIQCLLEKYPSMRGSFTKSLTRLCAAIKTLPQEDVDPQYYSFLEDTVVENFENLQARVVSALAWARRVEALKVKPVQGAAEVNVIAVPEKKFLSILINDNKTNVQFMYQRALEMRDKLAAAVQRLAEARLPEPMKTSIRKSFEQVIHCFSLEASVPYKMMDDIERFVGLLQTPYLLNGEMPIAAKLFKVKAENCLKDSKRENEIRLGALGHITGTYKNLDKILAEANRPYWMMDMPDVNERMKRSQLADLSAFTESLKRELHIAPPEKNIGCVCYRYDAREQSECGVRKVPLCPELLSYTEELRELWGIPPIRKDGPCHCSWLLTKVNRDRGGEPIDRNFRLYATHIKNTAKARDASVGVASCPCPKNRIRLAFGGTKQIVCFSSPRL